MDKLRTPAFVVAIVLALLVVLIETGIAAGAALGWIGGSPEAAARVSVQDLLAVEQLIPGAGGKLTDIETPEIKDQPPGRAIADMAFLDGILLFTVALMGFGLLVREKIQGRVQGVMTLVFSILIILGAIAALLAALAELLLMVALFLAVPFGTLAYMALYASFGTGLARAILSALMTLKVGFAVALVIAQQRFLQNKGLVLLIVTSLLGNVIVGLLHGIVPGFLVSITDAVAAIVVAVLAIIWAIILLVGAIIAVVKAVQATASLA